MAILFNETAVRRQVTEMRSIAAEMRRAAGSDMQNTVNASRLSWKGIAADAFRSRYEALGGNISREAGNIENLANSLERLAAEIARAEREAARIAAERNSSVK